MDNYLEIKGESGDRCAEWMREDFLYKEDTSFGSPWSVNDPPRMIRREGLLPGECSAALPIRVSPFLVDQNGTPHTEHPHRVLFCPSNEMLGYLPDDLCCRLIQMHKQGEFLYAVHEPKMADKIPWNEKQCRAMANGDRVISLFGVKSYCVVVWTCFWAPMVPKYRFVMMRGEFEHEFYHGFPVEKFVDGLNLKYPLEDEVEWQLPDTSYHQMDESHFEDVIQGRHYSVVNDLE